MAICCRPFFVGRNSNPQPRPQPVTLPATGSNQSPIHPVLITNSNQPHTEPTRPVLHIRGQYPSAKRCLSAVTTECFGVGHSTSNQIFFYGLSPMTFRKICCEDPNRFPSIYSAFTPMTFQKSQQNNVTFPQ